MRKYATRCIVILLICMIYLPLNITYAFFGLPDTDNLENLQHAAATQVFDINGQLISKLFFENRIVVSINNISPYIQQAIIANEDSRFYSHWGIDPVGIVRAIWVDIRQGSFIEGGSTITQQLAKNMFLTQERTFTRKLKEILLALVIERKFSKQEILQAYLNQVYFGEGAYGAEAAAQVYFGKRAKDLTLAESALIAGLPRGPNIYSPYVDTKAALQRRSEVLTGMVKEGYITPEQAQRSQTEPIVLAGKKKRVVQASYFLDFLSQELVGRYGANRVYKGGLKVYTTLDIKQQQAAEAVLGQYQGAVLALDPRNGYIKAMVGGRNYEESQINRVIAEIRQPGSAFKPFLYAAALNQGLTASSVIVDEPININGYKPQNYDKKNRGPITLKKALRWSVNVAAVKLGQQVGMDQVLNLARTMGISTLTAEDNNLAAALGGLTQGVNLFELTAAYTAFANSGILSKPIGIIKVLDEKDQVLEETRLSQQAVLKPETAYILTDMLKGVIANGTGTTANIGRPAAGKTGTTDNYETAWFIGYTPDLLLGIYVGNDDRKPVGISGTEVAGMWNKMMSQVTAGTPSSDFAIPPNVISGIAICADTGKLATKACPEIEYSAFVKGTQPTTFDTRPSLVPIPKEQPSTPAPERKPFWKLPWRLPGL
ncbi:MAG TPA: PBP1A family penicillin-binding protein [Methylomusa anaerophila]|uniref:Penicillin-binding protein 1F n=1 Tax=Methylomusa anaerophila TaxID=1930071 RepID=A0A348APQ9_9FIRM|nr:PBP1A family penicillin-binding protein [Methylomusa anaerophila]BBB93057.1 penicillin-binding protein 1F [Methylomusa anaerophila]HML87110.1 PBP1A family penicillin-binding protein [Methylomusa anaerophila]